MALRFLHIPKTAGSTFEGILTSQYAEKGHFAFSGNMSVDAAQFLALTEPQRKNIDLFTGHTAIATDIQTIDEAAIITFLRDPIARVKSFCQHVSEGKSPYLRKDFPPETFNLDQFLASGNTELSNLQTKMLINSGQFNATALIESLPFSDAKELALANLFGRVSQFGLTEFFDESLMVFSQSLNWSTPLYVSINKKNRANLINFDNRHLEQIAALNQIDIEVYKAARAKFVGRIESAAFDSKKLSLFRVTNALFQQSEKLKTQIKKRLR